MPAVADLQNGYAFGQSIRPDQWGATVNGSSVDCRDCGPEVTCIVLNGENEGTTETLDVKLQESDDDSTFTDITGATMTQITAGGHAPEVKTFYNRAKRYVRAVGTIAGTSPDIDFGVCILAPKTSY